MELRSVVDFLNKQMERTEVLLVEARQYLKEGMRIVVPTLFGYTEQARQVKRSVTVTTAASKKRKKWDRKSYFSDAATKLPQDGVKALEALLEGALDIGCEVTWGTGATKGSFNIKEPMVSVRSVLSVYSDGRIYFNTDWLSGSETEKRGRDQLKVLLSEKVGLVVHDDYATKTPTFDVSKWSNKVPLLVEALKEFVTEFRANVQ